MERDVSRRKVLATLGILGIGVTSLSSTGPTGTGGVSGREDAGGTRLGQNETGSSTPSERGAPSSGTTTAGPGTTEVSTATQSESDPNIQDIRDHGAAVDGETDDSTAIASALDAAAPGGTVAIPAGRIRIDTADGTAHGIRLGDSHRNVTIRGQGSHPSETQLVIAPEQTGTHFGIHVKGDGGDPSDIVRLANLTLEGNKTKHQDGPGTGIKTDGGNGKLEVQNCRVTSWRNAGLKLSGGRDADIRFCLFGNNGYHSNGGHDIAPNQDNRKTTTTVRWTLCTGSNGVAVDVGDDSGGPLQTVRIDWCVLRNGRGSLKIDPENETTVVRHTQMLGNESTTIPVKMNPGDRQMGKVTLDNVLIDGGSWPGIDCPNNGTIELDEVAIMNVDTHNRKRGNGRGGIHTDGIGFGSSGRVSVHNVGANNGGDALDIENGSGSIAEVIYGGVGEFGTSDGVTVSTRTENGDPIDPAVASVATVGPYSVPAATPSPRRPPRR